MRIIAGKCRAKKLVSPKTAKTRPTLDRVKEALFSIIKSHIIDAYVLDLFSGTGNLAIESISQGAKFAWINDIESLCISNIISNTELTKTEKYVKITRKDYIKCLTQISKEHILFDVIFLDPPYESNLAIKSLQYIDENDVLAKDGLVIYELDKINMQKLQKKDVNILDSFKNLECFDKRCYGNVILMIYRWR
ncbi:MAG: 16S rRNA (guanine(966)-N(2))-methyltransferase RsmD [Clostridia bacterium]